MTNASCLSDIQSPTGLPKDSAHSLAFGDQASDLVRGGREQRLGEPHPLPGQFPHDVEGLVSLLGLEAVDREDDLRRRIRIVGGATRGLAAAPRA